MGVPKSAVVWATAESVYSDVGRPWDAQPITVSPGSDYFTPQTGAPAQYMNHVLKRATQTGSDVRDAVSEIPVRNLTAISIGFTIDNFVAACAAAPDSDGVCRYAAVLSDTTHGYNLWGSIDGGKSWTRDTTLIVAAAYCITGVNSSTGTLLIGDTATNGNVGGIKEIVGGVGGTWTTRHVDPSLTTVYVHTKAVTKFLGLWIAVGSKSADNATNWGVFASSSSSPTLWTDRAISATLRDSTTNIGFVMVQSTTRLAVFPQTNATAQGQSHYTYATTDDGITWVTRTISGIPVGDSVTSATYDDVNEVFVVLTAASTNWAFKSSDGVNWTNVTTASTLGHNTIMTALGGLWVADEAYSSDMGVTWKRTPQSGLVPFGTYPVASKHDIVFFGSTAMAYGTSVG